MNSAVKNKDKGALYKTHKRKYENSETKGVRKKKKNPFIPFSIFILTFVSLVFLAFYISYTLVLNKNSYEYETTVNSQVSSINEINKGLATLVSEENKIDLSELENKVSGDIDTLTKSKDTISKVAIPEKYKGIHSDLIDGLSYNITMYKQIYSICQNLKSPNLESLLSDVNKNSGLMSGKYGIINSKSLNIYYPEEISTFLTAFNSEINGLIAENKNESEIAKNTKEYMDKINTLMDKLSPIYINYTDEITNARNNKTGFTEILNKISIAQNTISLINQDLQKIVPPEGCAQNYNSFINFNKEFEIYLRELKYAVSGENSLQGKNPKPDEITKLYSNIENLKTTTTNLYNDLNSSYSYLKLNTKY